MFGAAAMSLSSVCVVSNALRLNLFKLYDGSKDRKRSQKNKKNSEEEKENKTMKKVMKIRRNDVRTLRGESEKGS